MNPPSSWRRDAEERCEPPPAQEPARQRGRCLVSTEVTGTVVTVGAGDASRV